MPKVIIKTQISYLVRMTRFWNNLYHVHSNQKIGMPNNLKFWDQKKKKQPTGLNRKAKIGYGHLCLTQ